MSKAVMSGNEVLLQLSRRSAGQNRRIAHDDHAAVSCHIAHACQRLSADKDGEISHDDDVWRANAGTHVPHPSRRLASDQDGGVARRQNGPAHMWNEDCHHRTGMHITDTRCWLWH
jgi:hypothetical protein